MTLPKAKETFSQLMTVSRSRPLNDKERKALMRASQIIRYSRRTTAKNSNAKRERDSAKHLKKIRGLAGRMRSKRPTRDRTPNPRGVLIYKDITRVEGTKGNDSLYPGEKFFHNFKRPYPSMYGLPDGSLLIRKK